MAHFTFGVAVGGSANLTPITQNFSGITELTINHGLAYIPNVWVLDSSNQLIFVGVTFGTGTVTIYSNQTITGTIYIR